MACKSKKSKTPPKRKDRYLQRTYGSKYPVVDHCHTDGHIRGILCNECNRGLGYFHDSREALHRATLYVQNTIEF